MFLSLKTVMVTSIAVGGLAAGVAGAAAPPGNDVVQRVTAATEEQGLHASGVGGHTLVRRPNRWFTGGSGVQPVAVCRCDTAPGTL
ncbi:MAG TPA: hypothetical protein VND44_12495 [Acidimicrobiales bacterium]|nr:hypothetical protein [Acidimicrobiales bacterium]